MNKITVMTYNILAQPLADLMIDNNIYTKKIMNEKYRLELILKKLKKAIKYTGNLVICLQEVSEEWLPELATFFSEFEYKYINIQYGRSFNGNMGVLIAYPYNIYTITSSEFYNVGQHIIVTDEISARAAGKQNIAILLILQIKKTLEKIGIVTYHMPCEYTIPLIGKTHCKVLLRKINKYMGDIDWIWGGDFNMTPDSYPYKYIIKFVNCIWRDIYNSYPITNHAYIKEIEFKGCLDYIFYPKSNIKCINVSEVTNVKNIIPDKKEPSDHIPIMATFKY
jgi:mRNA deadenylase 3'-5' endonuclease subunit Ccr4